MVPGQDSPHPSTDPRPPGGPGFSWWWLLAPLIASAAVRDLWAPDEPRYGQVAREVWETGSFLVMHLCGDVYPDKPPLLYWISGLFGWISGWSELALRVPSLAATAGTAWLIARLARRWWGPVEAAWAPALYLGFAMVTEIGGRLQLDPLLTLFGTAALVLVTEPAVDPRRAGRLVLAAGLAVGLGVLTKGPIGLVNVCLPLAAWRWRGGRGAVVRAGRWPWIGAAVLAVAPALGWALAASLAEPGLARELFFGQHVGRVTQADRHPGPPWKHLTRMPFLLAPWILLVIRELVGGWRDLRARSGTGTARAALWLLVLFVFYSAIPPKRDLYLLPAYPAAALLAGAALARGLREGRLPRWIALGTPAIAGLLGGLVAALGAAPLIAGAEVTARLPAELVAGLPWRAPLTALPLLAGAAVALAAARGRNLRRWAAAIALGWAGTATAAAFLVFDPMDAVKSARQVALEIAALPQRPAAIPCFDVQPEGYRFYGRIPAVRGSAERLAEAWRRDGDQFLALVTHREWAAWPEAERARYRVLIDQVVGGRDVVVLGAGATTGGQADASR